MIGCTAVGVAGGGVEVEDASGSLGVRGELRRGPGRTASRSRPGKPTRRLAIVGLARRGSRSRHAADARRSVLVPGRRLPRALQRARARAHRHRRPRVGRDPARREPARARRPCAARAARSRCSARHDVPVRAVVSQGCRPIGKPLTVTRSERNLVYELAGQPAMARLQELVQAADEDERELMRERPARSASSSTSTSSTSRAATSSCATCSAPIAAPARSRSARPSTSARRCSSRSATPTRPTRICAPARRRPRRRRAVVHVQRAGPALLRRRRITTQAPSRSCSAPCRSRARSAPARSVRSAAATSLHGFTASRRRLRTLTFRLRMTPGP